MTDKEVDQAKALVRDVSFHLDPAIWLQNATA